MRYLLFGSDHRYYAEGGAHDFMACSDTVAILIKTATGLMEVGSIAWWHIFDFETKQIVTGSEEQAWGAPILSPP